MTKFDTKYLKKNNTDVTTSWSVKLMKPYVYRPDWKTDTYAGEIKKSKSP
ncbi:MAG: hypothetical protein K8S87_10280 [Planctomycetes bacterium]|nr:hypothetical protein [Planctomycetota bacterium]